METQTMQLVQDRTFKLGMTVMTCGVNEEVATNTEFAKFVLASLRRHARGDWGELPDEDWLMNEDALRRTHDGKLQSRLFSVYEREGLPKIWIITEWDESATTVLFPNEY